MKSIKMKKIILFNAKSGELLGSFESENFDVNGIDKTVISYKEVEMSETEFWQGNYTTGKIYNSSEIKIVTQQTLRDNAIEKIYSKYFYIDQIKIIVEQLKSSVARENQTENFKNMTEFIDEVRKEYHLKKEAYSSNPEAFIWVSDEEAQESIKNRYEGLI